MINQHFGVGDKVKIVYVNGTGKYPKTDVIAFSESEDIPKDFKVNSKIMVEKSIINKVEQILDAAGFDVNELLNETSPLESFF